MDVLDPDVDGEPHRMLGSHKLINQLKTGDVLGEMGFLRSVPRSATVIAPQPVELLKSNWKMIKRLHWLYPPTAQRFFFNLMTLICEKLEKLSECFSEIKVRDDSTGLYNKDNFLKILDSEISRSRRYRTNLSLCFMRFDFEGAGPAPDNFTKERILRSIGEAFSIQIRKYDTLGRFDHKTFALLMPHTSTAEAQLFCDRLKQLLAGTCKQIDGVQVKLSVGLTDVVGGADESASDMLARATNLLHHAQDA